MVAIHIDPYTATIERSCQDCGDVYRICDFIDHAEHYFHKPERYIDGCEQFCLSCWLGVGPNDFPDDLEPTSAICAPPDLSVTVPNNDFRVGRFEVDFEHDDEAFYRGDLLGGFDWFFKNGWQLAILPIARVRCLQPVFFHNGAVIYPPHVAVVGDLNPVANQIESENIAEASAAASGVDQQVFEKQSIMVVPCKFDWENVCVATHAQHLQLIRDISECVDTCCLDFLRYKKCRLDSVGLLPSRAGQIRNNPRMAGLMLYSPSSGMARIFGGASFTHSVNDGMGMPVPQVEFDQLPLEGEMGAIASHALNLYAQLLETSSATSRFMHAIGLLEYLAFPGEYRQLKKVKATVVSYVATSKSEHHRLSERFKDDLFGPNGYRTKIVHNGERLETLIPASRERTALFNELDGYIRKILDDMIAHSTETWDEYLRHRMTLGYEDGVDIQ